MIKQIQLINFQIHKELKIDFDSRFNIILGSNDKGKSSIIRALYWVFYNQPVGDWMRRIDEDGKQLETKVVIKFEDGAVVKRIKGDGVNEYVVNGESYLNFGHGVPESIQEVLKIRKFKTSKEEFPIHVSMQDDLPFLIHESSILRGGVIDVLTGMSIVQKGISDFKKEKNDSNRELKIYEEEYSKTLLVLENLESVEDLEDDLKVIEKEDNECDALNKRCEQLKKILINLININSLIKKHNILKECVLPDKMVKHYEDMDNEIVKFKVIKERMDSNRKEINRVNLILKNCDLIGVKVLIQDLEFRQKDLEIKISLYKKLKSIIKEIEELNLRKVKCKDLLDILEKQLDICPMCGRKL